MGYSVKDAYDIAVQSMKVFSCYLDETERDEEKCKKLRQSLEALVGKIDAEKAFLIHLLDKTIGETEKLYHNAMSVLHRAIENQDEDMACVASHFVSTVYNEHVIRKKR